jgi:hypothetical protein
VRAEPVRGIASSFYFLKRLLWVAGKSKMCLQFALASWPIGTKVALSVLTVSVLKNVAKVSGMF